MARASTNAGADRRVAFETTALPLVPALHRAALHLTRDKNLAADLVQDTCLRAYRAFDQFQPGTNCRAWLFSILYSVFNSGYRKAQREAGALQTVALEAGYERWLAKADATDEIEWPADAPHDMDARVERALDGLPAGFRDVVMLVDVAELSYEEAASAMSCAVGTVRSRLFRARKYLFTALLPYAREEGYGQLLERA